MSETKQTIFESSWISNWPLTPNFEWTTNSTFLVRLLLVFGYYQVLSQLLQEPRAHGKSSVKGVTGGTAAVADTDKYTHTYNKKASSHSNVCELQCWPFQQPGNLCAVYRIHVNAWHVSTRPAGLRPPAEPSVEPVWVCERKRVCVCPSTTIINSSTYVPKAISATLCCQL